MWLTQVTWVAGNVCCGCWEYQLFSPIVSDAQGQSTAGEVTPQSAPHIECPLFAKVPLFVDPLWLSQLATGCVTCHTSHGCVTHFRPILGNLVEVTLVTSPFMYIVSHAKGTSFP